ncbi:MAG: tRNA pseudouridine(65) synthase TruC [Cryobacterium sp.]|nr:tRNA pseudouridine(65) synthase TruC [Oligoflexia bacterium]
MLFRILHQSAEFVAVDKPYGVHVHPPEDVRFRISKNENGLAILRDQMGQYVYPVHRLDRSTSGVLLYALSSEAASKLAPLFSERTLEKTYYAIVRGDSKDSGRIDSPLGEEGKTAVGAVTSFEKVSSVELAWPNERFPTSRYSLLRINPETGRYHQIRRHLRRENHPIIGDTQHGDGLHNRLWRAEIGRPYLFLKCYSMGFTNPFDGKPLVIRSSWNSEWMRAFDRFGVCPRNGHRPFAR